MRRSNSPLFWLVTVPVVAGLLAGCDGPTDLDRDQEIDFRLDLNTYTFGDTATLTLENGGPNPIGPAALIFCGLHMELEVEGSWTSVDPPPAGVVCTRGVTLEPGEGLEREIPITSDDFELGREYRFVVEQGWFEGEDYVTTVVRSDPFTVVE